MSTDDTNLKAEIVDTDANDGEKISDDNSDQNPRCAYLPHFWAPLCIIAPGKIRGAIMHLK